ncbi:MAG: ABC transporter ATP-binding protein [Candidatus Thermoplasmatota archaeon]|nr:ABC transporter ATP-binding protein [Candidatus Thermoplasmatota archaeon]
MPPVIQARHLVKKFGTTTAVDDLSLAVHPGEIFGLLGPNGSGKTTTIKMLTGQTVPTEGTATVAGLDVRVHPLRVREQVGIIPEQEMPPSFLTADEYLHFVGAIRGLSHMERRCSLWYDLLDFGDQKDMLCKDLSRGTRQKVMFAQAFLHEPRVAFVDEPLINLDPIVQRTVKNYLQDFVARGGTVFFCTHVLEIAQALCTQIGIIYRGRLVYQGDREDITRRHAHLEDLFLDMVHREHHASSA